MGTKFKTRTFIDDWRDEGRAEGEANALFAVLAARGIDVPDAARDRISGCKDLSQITTWIQRAATATSIDDVITT